MTILFFIGTRPEAIKMAPVIHKFREFEYIEVKVCLTSQHQELLLTAVDFFEIHYEFNLNLMKPNQSLPELTSKIITETDKVIKQVDPDVVFVQGDTTTAFAASLASFYNKVKICHIEAGLRTGNKLEPYPEEINRGLISKLTDIHFAPTEQAKLNLLKENIKKESIVVTGNTVIDSLFYTMNKMGSQSHFESKYQNYVQANHKLILVTGHRRENHGEGLKNICLALNQVSKFPDVKIIWPVHPNPNVLKAINQHLEGNEKIKLVESLEYEEFVWLMHKSFLVITDSGGVQEEAPSLGKPVLVTRNFSERLEAVEAGTVILVGTNTDKIVTETENLLNNRGLYERMSQTHNPYGDGKAAEKICNFLIQEQNK